MYKKILTAVDGSPLSTLGMDAALALSARLTGSLLIGCHIYASRLHRTRFSEMERGLPDHYQEAERLSYLRETHEDLISEGMQLISDAYLAPLAEKALRQKTSFKGLTPEGHHYVEILKVMREEEVELTVLGAYGQGAVPEQGLGSVTERIMLYGDCGDLLIVRQPWQFKNRPILVGIDGSSNSFLALKRAVDLGMLLDVPVEAVAVFDPYFHSTVFQTIANSLPDEAAKKFNFTAQEKLHDEIIDRGLETLYREGLERAILMAKEMGCEIKTEVLAGKVFSQLHHYAALRNAGLVVMGRYGLHQEEESKIGSNCLKLTRLTASNVLIVHPPTEEIVVPELNDGKGMEHLDWEPEAEKIIERIPVFVRKMAVRSIEAQARDQGLVRVTAELVRQVSGRMGMKKGKG